VRLYPKRPRKFGPLLALLGVLVGAATYGAIGYAQPEALGPTAASAAAFPVGGVSAAAASGAVGLADEITVRKLALPNSFMSMVPGYNELPTWSRVDTATAPNGTIYVAWNASNGVHVAHLSAGRARIGADVVIKGAHEVSGLVAQPNGFAILTRQPGSNVFGDTEAHLLRYRGTTLSWNRQLTSNALGDSAPVLDGALAWSGSKYGAYFVIHGVSGPAKGHYGDALVYLNDSGTILPGGWGWGCSHNEGIALAPKTSGPFASLCFEDWRSGLFVSTGIGAPDNAPVISYEQCWAGYCGGQFGGMVRTAGGRFAVAFTTRGSTKVVGDGTGRGHIVTPRYSAHQLAFAELNPAASAVAEKKIVLSLNISVDHVDVRIAPYGANRLLLAYETVKVKSCSAGTCAGTFTGTHLQLLTLAGQEVGAAVEVPELISGQIGVLADGDLVWAYAPVRPDYAGPIGGPTDASATLDIAELSVG
jgi:hypothetical protein